MKNLITYIQEKYLIDLDTHDYDIENCFQERDPDFIADSPDDLSKYNKINKEIIDFIKTYTSKELYVWKCKYDTSADYQVVANDSQYHRQKTGYNKADITSICNVKAKRFGDFNVMILIDKKDKSIVPEIWIIKEKKPQYCLFIEPRN